MLRLFKRPQPRAAKFLQGRVGYAVGDIHGCADLLEDMLALLEQRAGAECRDAGPPIVVFLGDYVDRGPDSAGVLDLLLSGRPHGFERRFLRGNHERSMMAFLREPYLNRGWLLQGGAETLLSYGLRPPSPVGATEDQLGTVAKLLHDRMPCAHHEFLAGLERYVCLGDYAFVHAGVDASRPLDQQTDQDLYWSRAAFIASKRRFSHRIVHGHTPSDAPYVDERRIGVDTGAYASGLLTTARFEDENVSFGAVARRERPSSRARAEAELVDWG